MHYFYTKLRGGDITEVIRANFSNSTLLHDIANYAILRGSDAYGGIESNWDTAVAFNLCPCIEFDGREFMTIHEPNQNS